MEKKRTSPLVYILLVAVILALGVFIFRRIQQNAEDRKTIDKLMDDVHKSETGAR